MNYYIQGDAANADQIKAAFEKLGIDVTGFDMCNDNILFFTYELEGDGKVISTTNANLYTANIIKPHPDYKELKFPVTPKFKVGDKVIYNGKQHTVTFVNDKYYGFSGGVAGCRIELQDQLLSPAPKPHYDIANFKPFDKVLGRNCCRSVVWRADYFSHIHKNGKLFVGISYTWEQCIPFNDDTKHLLGATDMCDEQYINW